jgi:hypothetical protein
MADASRTGGNNKSHSTWQQELDFDTFMIWDISEFNFGPADEGFCDWFQTDWPLRGTMIEPFGFESIESKNHISTASTVAQNSLFPNSLNQFRPNNMGGIPIDPALIDFQQPPSGENQTDQSYVLRLCILHSSICIFYLVIVAVESKSVRFSLPPLSSDYNRAL